jgi:hypothetical protein
MGFIDWLFNAPKYTIDGYYGEWYIATDFGNHYNMEHCNTGQIIRDVPAGVVHKA